jgi:DNA-binding MurR/RpiR family transcriptional regulator
VDAVIAKTLESQPRNATHWSTRTMANEMGLSQTAVSRIWRAFGLQPHRQETFKLSTDPQFVAKTRDIVDTYNENPKPFIWTKTADDILAIIERFCPRISNSQH